MMREITFLKAINEAVDEELGRDPNVILLGEDIRIWGGPLGEYGGLYDKYGDDRVFDTPISETAIMGTAIGSAATGMRPIANIMFSEFLGICFSEILNILAKLRYMTGGKVSLPVTITTYSGAGISASGEHSSCFNGLLMSITGLKIAVPSTPYDAKGLIKAAIREDTPVIVPYHKFMILNGFKGEVPDEDYIIPLGKADVKREGTDVTVVATALMVHRALAAAEMLQEKGISVEVIDPRTLIPLDKEAIFKSLEKTGRLIIMEEDPVTASAACQISSIVAEEAFDLLDAPIKRVCCPDTPVPFSPYLEKIWMPDEENLISAVNEIM
jgi:pyruvate/2-oxoglutarate/acetoin dehydrogenase E1 component